MIKKRKYLVEEEHTEIISKICDVCGTEYTKEQIFEVQEFFHIYFTGGYGSVFSDGDRFECDICQHCLKKILGKYIRNIDDNNKIVNDYNKEDIKEFYLTDEQKEQLKTKFKEIKNNGGK